LSPDQLLQLLVPPREVVLQASGDEPPIALGRSAMRPRVANSSAQALEFALGTPELLVGGSRRGLGDREADVGRIEFSRGDGADDRPRLHLQRQQASASPGRLRDEAVVLGCDAIALTAMAATCENAGRWRLEIDSVTFELVGPLLLVEPSELVGSFAVLSERTAR
jgi:hypothetical protein